jgi:Tol biopolymer transport system component
MNLALSRDGRQAALDRFDATAGIWIFDTIRNISTRATVAKVYESTPVWAPDGRAFVFAAARDTPPNLYVHKVGESQEDERLFRSTLQSFPQSWSPDGESIVYVTIDPKTRADIWLVPRSGDRKPRPLIQTDFAETGGRISPDGHWLVYTSNESGRVNVYVTRFPEATGKWPVSPSGGSHPAWSRDGRELYYRAPNGAIMSVPIERGAEFAPGPPAPLFTPKVVPGGLGLGMFYDVAPDGRFLVTVFVERITTPATVVLNWRPGGPE